MGLAGTGGGVLGSHGGASIRILEVHPSLVAHKASVRGDAGPALGLGGLPECESVGEGSTAGLSCWIVLTD